MLSSGLHVVAFVQFVATFVSEKGTNLGFLDGKCQRQFDRKIRLDF